MLSYVRHSDGMLLFLINVHWIVFSCGAKPRKSALLIMVMSRKGHFMRVPRLQRTLGIMSCLFVSSGLGFVRCLRWIICVHISPFWMPSIISEDKQRWVRRESFLWCKGLCSLGGSYFLVNFDVSFCFSLNLCLSLSPSPSFSLWSRRPMSDTSQELKVSCNSDLRVVCIFRLITAIIDCLISWEKILWHWSIVRFQFRQSKMLWSCNPDKWINAGRQPVSCWGTLIEDARCIACPKSQKLRGQKMERMYSEQVLFYYVCLNYLELLYTVFIVLSLYQLVQFTMPILFGNFYHCSKDAR